MKTKTTYRVVRAFDWLSEREYTFSVGKAYVNVRRTDDPETGTFLQLWQFKQALRDGWIKAVAS